MTSTSFNVGMNSDTRNSSRVLKPPGGGHTDIFGNPEPEVVKKDNRRNASSITEGTNSFPVQASPVKKAAEPPKITQEAPAAPSSRARVPPGGFSSGLW